MNYDFSLDTKSIGFLLVGCVLLVALIFVAGLLTGANWNTTSVETATTTTTRKTVVASETEESALPKEPVIKDTALKTDALAAPAETDHSAKPVDAAPAVEGKGESKKETPKTTALTTSLMPESEAKIVQTAKPDASETSDADDASGIKRVAFSIQVGTFLEEKEARRFIEVMESKGYTPSVFVANDVENRQWYSVRIGAYTDQTEAAQAASNFTKQEKIKAVVRPIGSL